MTYDDLQRAASASMSADNLRRHLGEIARSMAAPAHRLVASIGPIDPKYAYDALWKTWRDQADILEQLGVTGFPMPPTLDEVLRVVRQEPQP